MEKDEKTIIEPVVDDTVIVNSPEEQVDNNTVIEPEPVDAPVEPVVADPVPDEPIVPPVEDATLAPTDDVIPAPVDVPTELPEEPAPVVSDVVPEAGDECPTDGCCDTGGACCGENPCCPGTITIGAFFGTLQECVSIAWRFHLKTRKHHIHVALNEFYGKALYLIDNIVEQYQGIYGVVDDAFVNCLMGDDKTEAEYLTALKSFIETNKHILGEHSEINSVIDELLGLIDSTVYKITSFTEHAVKSFDEFVYEDYDSIKESCKYDRFGDRSCDDPDDPDFDPDFDGGEEEE